MELRGSGGRLAQAGRLIAELGAWQAVRSGADLQVRARPAGPVDAFWLQAAGSKRLTLAIGTRQFTWTAQVVAAEGPELILRTEGRPT